MVEQCSRAAECHVRENMKKQTKQKDSMICVSKQNCEGVMLCSLLTDDCGEPFSGRRGLVAVIETIQSHWSGACRCDVAKKKKKKDE